MKMSKEQYAALKAAMHEGLKLVPPAAKYQARDPSIPRIDLAKDTAKRHRWDAFWASRFDAQPFYAAGLDDSHIDTALRAIVKESSGGPVSPAPLAK